MAKRELVHVHGDGCLIEAAGVHVAYELRLLGSMAGAEVMPTEYAGTTYTPLLESFAVHVRNLIEFLTDSHNGGWQHRVIASDFFDEAPEHRWPIEPAELGERLQRMVSRKVSHVFCDRADPNLGWAAPADRVKWAESVFLAFERFLADLGRVHEKRVAWFGDAIDEGRELIATGNTRAWVLVRQDADGQWVAM